MSARHSNTFITINSGQTLSEVAHVDNAKSCAVMFPIVTSCQAYLHGGYEINGTVVTGRMLNWGGSGDFTMDIGVGSRGMAIDDYSRSASHLRIETTVAQTDVRTFTVISQTF